MVENGRTDGNPIGHTAITGLGVFSFGNNTKCGSSLADYLWRETPRQNTKVFVIKTTPAQDAAALAELQKFGKCDRELHKTRAARKCASLASRGIRVQGQRASS